MADEQNKINLNKLLQDIIRENLEIVRQTTDGVRDSLNATKDLAEAYRITNEQAKSINKNNRDLAAITAKLATSEEKRTGNLRDSKDISKDILKTDSIRKSLGVELIAVSDKLNAARKAGDKNAIDSLESIKNGLRSQIDVTKEIKKSLKGEAIASDKIKNSFGLLGGSLQVVNKLLGGNLLNIQGILSKSKERLALLEKEDKLQDGIAGKVQGFKALIEETGKSIRNSLNDPLIYLTSSLDFNNTVGGLRRNLALSYGEALKLRHEMSLISMTSDTLLVNSKALISTLNQLNEQFGTSAQLEGQTLVDATKILEAKIMTIEATANLTAASNLNGNSIRENLKAQIGAVTAAESEFGTRLNIRQVLEQSNKISGQIRAQLGANPELIAKSVAVAKELGFELEQIANSGNAILDFQSSIEAELEAELLIGRQLNLEQARLAALTGDYETLTREITSNVGDFYEFSKLNVLQQNALAKSVGMTSDQLSNSLLKQANLNELQEKARTEGNEQILQNLEALSTQEKFNKAVEKLKGLFVDIIGIFDPIIQGIGFVASLAGSIAGQFTLAGAGIGLMIQNASRLVPLFRKLVGLARSRAIFSTLGGFGALGPVGLLAGAGAVVGMLALANKFMTADDMISPGYGKRILTSPEGTIALNNKDTVVAGTNLGTNSPSIDYDKMATAMSKVRVTGDVRFDEYDFYSTNAPQGAQRGGVKYGNSVFA